MIRLIQFVMAVGLVLLGMAGQAAESVLLLPAGLGHHLVLIPSQPDRQDYTPILWGWTRKDHDVEVQWKVNGEKIEAFQPSSSSKDGWRPWVVRPRDLKQPLQTGDRLQVTLSAVKSRKTVDQVVLTNGLVGPVWVVGVESTGMPGESLNLAKAPGEAWDRIRLLRAGNFVWSTWKPGEPDKSLDWQRAANLGEQSPSTLSAQTLELIRRWAKNGTTPVGLILVDRRVLGTLVNQRVGVGKVWRQETDALLQLLPEVNREVSRQYESLSQTILAEKRQAKRRGQIWVPTNGPVEVRRPDDLNELHEGLIPKLGYGVSGAIW